MEADKILTSSLDDLVFEGRNKSYGAYFLRQKYGRHIMLALLLAAIFYILAFSSPYIISMLTPAGAPIAKKVVKVSELSAPPPIDKNVPPPPPKLPPPPKRVVFTPPVIKPDEEVKQEDVPPPQDEAPKVDPGPTADANTDYNFDAAPAVVEEVKPQIFTYVEQMPEFPGGLTELTKFLSKNLRYPPAARENGIEGRVVLQFVVDESGKISDIQVLRDIGGGTAEEAQRVVKMMPPWKPGKQNGNPVKVYYKLPVTFKLSAE